MKRVALALLMCGIFAAAAHAADVNCCKMCCKGETCIMTHKKAHDCAGHPPASEFVIASATQADRLKKAPAPNPRRGFLFRGRRKCERLR